MSLKAGGWVGHPLRVRQRNRQKHYSGEIIMIHQYKLGGYNMVLDSASGAVHAVDECLDKVVTAILKNGGRCLITADHGNCEYMWDYAENAPFTAHTTNPVPCVYVDAAEKDVELREGGRLSDLAPTLLDMLGLPKPAEMTGSTLFAG